MKAENDVKRLHNKIVHLKEKEQQIKSLKSAKRLLHDGKDIRDVIEVLKKISAITWRNVE